MQELVVKNYLKSIFLFITCVVVLTGIMYLKIMPAEMPLPVYILGSITGFLAFCSFVFPKATPGQLIQLSIIGVLINSIFLIAVYFINLYLQVSFIIINPEFILSVNPFLAGGCIIAGLIFIVGTFEIKEVEHINPETEFIDKKEELNKEQDEQTEKTYFQEAATEDKQNEENEITYETEVVKIELPFKKDEKKITENAAKNPSVAKHPSVYEELYPMSSMNKKTNEPEEDEIDLEELPEEDLKNKESILLKSHETLDETTKLEAKTAHENNVQPEFSETAQNNDFIPTNIRLNETKQVKETESRGRIASIGKLLVNNRDIENVIQTSENAQECLLSSRTSVITTISGEKIYDKLSKMKEKFEHIKELALIDQGGFLIANDFEDKQKAQMTGALISGAYHTLHNYLSQIPLSFPARIFFETSKTNSFIVKTKEEILFSNWDKAFKHIEYGPLEEMVNSESLTEIDIKPYTDLMEINDFVIIDSQGKIINSIEFGTDPQKYSAVSSAIFENLKVFLMNIQLIKLSKIVVFTHEKVLTIAKSGDKIISLLTPIDNYPKISENLLNLENIEKI